MFRFWIKILNYDEKSWIKCIYKTLKYDANNSITYNNNWAFQIKPMFETLGLHNL